MNAENVENVGIDFLNLVLENTMAKLSREQIIAELDTRNIGHTDDMSYPELCELLKKAEEVPGKDVSGTVAEVPAKPKAPSKLEAAMDALRVEPIPVGVDSVNALNQQVQVLELRVRALEGRL